MADTSQLQRIPAALLKHLSRVDPAWQAVIDRANRGGPGSSPDKPLYIAGWDPGGVPRLKK
jgi:hypothetical protein